MEREEQQADRKTKQTRSRQVKKTHFFSWAPRRHTTAAGREARMTEVEPQRPEAGGTTDPIAPTEPAVGMRAGR